MVVSEDFLLKSGARCKSIRFASESRPGGRGVKKMVTVSKDDFAMRF